MTEKSHSLVEKALQVKTMQGQKIETKPGLLGTENPEKLHCANLINPLFTLNKHIFSQQGWFKLIKSTRILSLLKVKSNIHKH